MEQNNTQTIITIVGWLLGLGILSGIALLIKKAAKEISEFFGSISLALEDNKLTMEELNTIVKEFKDIIAVVKSGKKTK